MFTSDFRMDVLKEQQKTQLCNSMINQAAQYGICKLELHNCLICMSVKEVHMVD